MSIQKLCLIAIAILSLNGVHEILLMWNGYDVYRQPSRLFSEYYYFYWIGSFFLWIFGFAVATGDLNEKRPDCVSYNDDERFKYEAIYYGQKAILLGISCIGLFAIFLHLAGKHVAVFVDSGAVQWCMSNLQFKECSSFLESANYTRRGELWTLSIFFNVLMGFFAFRPSLNSELAENISD